MKRISLILAGAMTLAALASCDHKAEFNKVPFVRFNNSGTVSVKEDAGSVTIPVSSFSNDGGTGSATFTVAGTAVEGVNYTIEPANGVLNFNGNETQNITVKVIDIPGVFTGNFTLQLTLSSTSGDLSLGSNVSKVINIVDNDVKVDWDYLVGDWAAQDYTIAGAEDGGAYAASIKKVDDKTITLFNLWGGEKELTGTVTFDEASNTATILFPAQQVVYYYSAYGNMILLGQNDSGAWSYSPVKAVVSGDGITIGPWNMLITAGDSAGYLYSDGYITVLTK